MAQNQNVTIFDASAVYLAERDTTTGAIGRLVNIGLSTAFKVALTTDEKEMKSPKGELIQSIPLIPSASLSIDMRDITPANLALGLKAVLQTLEAGVGKKITVSNPKAGDIALFGAVNVSNVTASLDGQALAAAGNFIVDSKFGKVTLIADQAGEVEFTFDTAAQKALGLMTDSTKEYFVRIEAIDLANGRPVVFEIYRVKFTALSEFNLIGEDFATIPLTGKILVDNTQPADSVYGSYARYMAL